MRIRHGIYVVLVTVFALGSTAASGETLYVSDVLIVNLRAEPSNSAETLRLLRTGQEVELLERTGRFLKVRTSEGEVGWVQEQYLTPETPKATVIQDLRTQVSRLRARVQEAEGTASELTGELEALQNSASTTTSDLEEALEEARSEATRTATRLEEVRRLYEDLRARSEDVLQVTEDRDRLRQERETMTRDLERLQEERSSLVKSAAIRWFLAGAGVFVLGWLVGTLSRKKRGRFTV